MTNTVMSTSYLDLHMYSDSEDWSRTKLYNKKEDFNFPIYISASYPDWQMEMVSEDRIRTVPYDKKDDFNFLIVNFPFII